MIPKSNMKQLSEPRAAKRQYVAEVDRKIGKDAEGDGFLSLCLKVFFFAHCIAYFITIYTQRTYARTNWCGRESSSTPGKGVEGGKIMVNGP